MIPAPVTELLKDKLTPSAPDRAAEMLDELATTIPRVLQQIRSQLMERYATSNDIGIGKIVVRVVSVIKWRLIKRLNAGIQKCHLAVLGPDEKSSNRGQGSQNSALRNLRRQGRHLARCRWFCVDAGAEISVR